MLDVPSITFLSNYLQTYPSTVLVVSHDRAFLNEVATDIIHQHTERLDYYRGANFGESNIGYVCNDLVSTLMNVFVCRILLCHKGGKKEDTETGIRESNEPKSTSPRYSHLTNASL